MVWVKEQALLGKVTKATDQQEKSQIFQSPSHKEVALLGPQHGSALQERQAPGTCPPPWLSFYREIK